MNRKQLILDKALEMFNERGIEYVGLRELAAKLNMRVSNITYYFPTKDDLVYEISLELTRKNSMVIVADSTLTMRGFLGMLHQVFKNHLQFRCLLLSFVHVMEQNKVVAASYKRTQKTRNDTLKVNIDTLEKSGYLKVEEVEENEFLVSTLALVSRFWISEAAVSLRHLTEADQIKHYLRLIARLLLPYTTTKGKKEIRLFLQELN